MSGVGSLGNGLGLGGRKREKAFPYPGQTHAKRRQALCRACCSPGGVDMARHGVHGIPGRLRRTMWVGIGLPALPMPSSCHGIPLQTVCTGCPAVHKGMAAPGPGPATHQIALYRGGACAQPPFGAGEGICPGYPPLLPVLPEQPALPRKNLPGQSVTFRGIYLKKSWAGLEWSAAWPMCFYAGLECMRRPRPIPKTEDLCRSCLLACALL